MSKFLPLKILYFLRYKACKEIKVLFRLFHLTNKILVWKYTFYNKRIYDIRGKYNFVKKK